MRVVTVAGDPEREAQLAAQLELRRDVELVLRCVDRVEALGALRGGSLDAMVVVGDPVWFDSQCGEEAVATGTNLIALAPDPLVAERMRRLGAVVGPHDMSVEEVVAACGQTSVVSPREYAEEPASRGSITAVWGPKGAPGRTSIACELASELSWTEPDTLLVDADSYGGDLMQLLGVVDDLPTIVWASRLAAKRELDAHLDGRDLRRVGARGPILLPGIPRSDLWPEISDHGWKELLQTVCRRFRFVVCDVGFSLEPDPSPYPEAGEGRNRLTRTTLRSADYVVALVRADPIGIKNFLWAYEHVREIVDEDKVLVVANRVQPDEGKEVSDLLKRYLRKRPIALVPEDPARFSESMTDAMPVRTARPNSPIAAAISEVASAVGGRSSRRGFLARLGGRV